MNILVVYNVILLISSFEKYWYIPVIINVKLKIVKNLKNTKMYIIIYAACYSKKYNMVSHIIPMKYQICSV